MIDFGNANDLIAVHNSMRKRSFTLPEGVEGDEDDLNERKKKLKTEKEAAQLSDEACNAYR